MFGKKGSGSPTRVAVDIAEARAEQALLAYRQTLLEAVGEVEDALVSIRAVEARTAELERAVTASEQAFDQLDALYREGLASFIDILDAQRTLIDSRESLLDSQAEGPAASEISRLHRGERPAGLAQLRALKRET